MSARVGDPNCTLAHVLRDVERLRRHAALVAADLAATIDKAWNCAVTDDRVLSVHGDGRLQRVELDADVDVDAWPEEAWSHQFRDVTLEDDASEAVATAVQEVLWSWGLNWPVCRDHLTACSPCSGVWACDGHDLADVGALVPAVAQSAAVPH